MLHYHIDAYNRYHGYTLAPSSMLVAVLHFACHSKPWNLDRDAIVKLPAVGESELEAIALQFWSNAYDRMCNSTNSLHNRSG